MTKQISTLVVQILAIGPLRSHQHACHSRCCLISMINVLSMSFFTKQKSNKPKDASNTRIHVSRKAITAARTSVLLMLIHANVDPCLHKEQTTACSQLLDESNRAVSWTLGMARMNSAGGEVYLGQQPRRRATSLQWATSEALP